MGAEPPQQVPVAVAASHQDQGAQQDHRQREQVVVRDEGPQVQEWPVVGSGLWGRRRAPPGIGSTGSPGAARPGGRHAGAVGERRLDLVVGAQERLGDPERTLSIVASFATSHVAVVVVEHEDAVRGQVVADAEGLLGEEERLQADVGRAC